MKKLFLIATIGLFLFTSCGGSSKTETATTIVPVASEATDGVKRTTMTGVQGLCEMCKERIETAAKSVKGVQAATWEADTKKLVLTSAESLDMDAVAKAVATVGHDNAMHKADDKVYSALPSCCQYR